MDRYGCVLKCYEHECLSVVYDRRSTEISLVIRQSLEASILTHLMPRSQVNP